MRDRRQTGSIFRKKGIRGNYRLKKLRTEVTKAIQNQGGISELLKSTAGLRKPVIGTICYYFSTVSKWLHISVILPEKGFFFTVFVDITLLGRWKDLSGFGHGRRR